MEHLLSIWMIYSYTSPGGFSTSRLGLLQGGTLKSQHRPPQALIQQLLQCPNKAKEAGDAEFRHIMRAW